MCFSDDHVLEGQAHGLAVGGFSLQHGQQAVEPGVDVDLLTADADASRGAPDGARERASLDHGIELVVAHGDLEGLDLLGLAEPAGPLHLQAGPERIG